MRRGTVVSLRNNWRHKKTSRPCAKASNHATESNNERYEILDVDDEDKYIDNTDREPLYASDEDISEDNGRHIWRKIQHYVDCSRENLHLLREEHVKNISARVADDNEEWKTLHSTALTPQMTLQMIMNG